MQYAWLIGVWGALCLNGYWIAFSDAANALPGFTPVLIAICITTAIFAINFSFYQYQTSPYKELRRQFSPVHIRLAILIFLLSILPLLTLTLSVGLAANLSLTLIPTIGVLGFILLLIAKNEVDIINIIRIQASKRKITQFLKVYSTLINKSLVEIDKSKLSDIQDTPTHEWQWTISPQQPLNSPILFLESANFLIVKNGDVTSFSGLFKTVLDLVESTFLYQPKHIKTDDHRIKKILDEEVTLLLGRICSDAIKSDDSCSFSRVIINQVSERLVAMASEFRQSDGYSFCLLSIVNMTASKAYGRGVSSIGLSAISLTRSIVNKGLDKHGTSDIDYSLYRHALPQLTYPIRALASQAIKNNDSEFLYRCLDAYGWLGCAAAKKLSYEVTKECLRSLAQLGREARASNLECFWTRCSISPWGHAEERIGWIFSWIAKIDETERDIWMSATAEAYRRLLGHKVELNVERKGDKLDLKIIKKDDKHIVHYSDHGHQRSIDYSDFSFLKDMEMY